MDINLQHCANSIAKILEKQKQFYEYSYKVSYLNLCLKHILCLLIPFGKNILDWSLIVHFPSVCGTRDCKRTAPGDLSLQALVCQSVCLFNSQAVAWLSTSHAAPG